MDVLTIVKYFFYYKTEIDLCLITSNYLAKLMEHIKL